MNIFFRKIVALVCALVIFTGTLPVEALANAISNQPAQETPVQVDFASEVAGSALSEGESAGDTGGQISASGSVETDSQSVMSVFSLLSDDMEPGPGLLRVMARGATEKNVPAGRFEYLFLNNNGIPLSKMQPPRRVENATEIPAIASGVIGNNAPQRVVGDVYEQGNTEPVVPRHEFFYQEARVGKVTVYNVGVVSISNGSDVLEYVYYTTDEQGTNLAYSVLAPDEKITLIYHGASSNVVEYKVEGPNGVAGTGAWSPDSIFGADRATVVADGHTYNINVAIPRGYTATIERTYTPVNGGTPKTETLTIHELENSNVEDKNTLGRQPQYERRQNTIFPKDGYENTIRRETTIPLLCHSDETITVKYEPYQQLKFDPTLLGQTIYVKDGNTWRAGTDDNWKKIDEISDNSYTWVATTNYWSGNQYMLDGLAINGTHLNIPMVSERQDDRDRVYTARTTLPTGTQVTVAGQITDGFGTNFPKRTYAVSITNCYEDVTFTGGNFVALKHREIIPDILQGVDFAYTRATDGEIQVSYATIPISTKPGEGYTYGTPLYFRVQPGFKPKDNVRDMLSLRNKNNWNAKHLINGVTALTGDQVPDTLQALGGEGTWYQFTLEAPPTNGTNNTMVLSIMADPYSFGVEFLPGAVGEHVGPNSMPSPTYRDGGPNGYNVLDNNTVSIPMVVPRDMRAPDMGAGVPMSFVRWNLVTPDGRQVYEDGNPIVYANGATMHLADLDDIYIPGGLDSIAAYNAKGDGRYVLYLQAEWREYDADAPVDFYVGFYLDGQMISDATRTHKIEQGGTVVVDWYSGSSSADGYGKYSQGIQEFLAAYAPDNRTFVLDDSSTRRLDNVMPNAPGNTAANVAWLCFNSEYSVGVNKIWNDGQTGAPVTVELLRNGAVWKNAELNAGNNWHANFANLPSGDHVVNGDQVTYTPYTYALREQGSTVSVPLNFGASAASGLVDGGTITVGGNTYAVGYSVSYDERGNASATIANARASLTLPVRKVVRGSDANVPIDKSFTFHIHAAESNPAGGATIAQNTTLSYNRGLNTQIDGSFQPVVFTAPGTYNFTLHEVTPSEDERDGYIFDESSWIVTVVVTRNEQGLLVVGEPSYSHIADGKSTPATAPATFTNIYDPAAVSTALRLTKTIRNADKDNPFPQTGNVVFYFRVTPEKAPDGVAVGSSSMQEINCTGEKPTHSVNVNYTYDVAGTYTYIIEEIEPTEIQWPGFTYDKDTWRATVLVEARGNNLEVQSVTYMNTTDNVVGSADTGAAFVNVYAPAPTQVTLAAQKTIAGVERPTEREFEFVLKPIELVTGGVLQNDSAITLDDSLTATVTGPGTATFAELTFVKAGTYGFKMSEKKPTPLPGGYTYDEKPVTVTVQVTDVRGQLQAAITYEKDGQNQSGAAFTNSYTPASVRMTPNVQKAVEGIEGSSETFAFTIAAGRNNPTGASLVYPQTLAASRTGAGVVPFATNALTFSRAGTYFFYITETRSTVPGYVYDNRTWTLKVDVEDQDGRLVIPAAGGVTYSVGNVTAQQATFTNHYTLKDVSVKKVWDDENNKAGVRPASVQAQLYRDGAEYGTPVTLNASNGWQYTWEDLLTGTVADGVLTPYTYTVREVGESGGKIELLGNTWAVTYDDTTVPDTTVITNSRVQVKLAATKVIAGDTKPSTPVNFYFHLTQMDYTGAPAESILPAGGMLVMSYDPAGSTTIAKDDAYTIAFTQPGTYRFTVHEDASANHAAGAADANGFVYDNVQAGAIVEVDRDAQGMLRVRSVQYYKGDQTNLGEENSILFTNRYEPTAAMTSLSITKTIEGGFPADQTASFYFEVTQMDGPDFRTPMMGTSPAQFSITGVQGDGSRTISPQVGPFDRAGTYYYTIRETIPVRMPGFTYDERIWNVTIKVVDDQSSPGALRVESVRYKSGSLQNITGATFTNTFKPATLKLAAHKTVNGAQWMPNADETFVFALSLVGNPAGVTMPNILRTTCANGRTAEFNAITFDRVGTYTFTVAEIPGDTAGFTYDGQSVTVTVTVSADQETGALVATPVYSKDGMEVENARFTNTFTTVSQVLNVEKVLNGHNRPVEQTFAFTLKDAKGEVKTITISGEGRKSFDALTYNQPGVYTYTITEEETTAPGYTDDPVPTWNVTVTVSKAENGALVASPVYSREHASTTGGTVTETSVTNARFTNEYQPAPAGLKLKLQKTVTSEHNLPGEAKFWAVVVQRGGNVGDVHIPGTGPVELAVSDDKRTATGIYGPITFNRAGEYTFEVYERDDGLHGYAYDTARYTVKVTVTDVNGQLTAAVEYKKGNNPIVIGEGDALEFKNTYTPQAATLPLYIGKQVNGDATGPATFDFTITAGENNPAVVVLPGNGHLELSTELLNGVYRGGMKTDNLTFTKAGTYTFSIRETKGELPGYTYDSKPVTVTVTVTDKGGRLEATAQYSKDNQPIGQQAAFYNTYVPTPAKVKLQAKKALAQAADRQIPAGRYDFVFALANVGTTVGVTMPDSVQQTATLTVIKDGYLPEPVPVDFDDVTFTKAGTYSFRISEVIPAADEQNGIDYDSGRWRADVVVEDRDGKLIVTGTTYLKEGATSDEKTPLFTNTYNPAVVTVPVSVTKTIAGQTENFLASGQSRTFAFDLYKKGGNAPASSLTLALPRDGVLTASGVFTVPISENDIVDGEDTAFVYTIRERVPSKPDAAPGFSYDSGEWNVTITASKSNASESGTRIQIKSVVYSRADVAGTPATATFTNTYSAAEAGLNLQVYKQITGQTPPKPGVFSFTLDAGDDYTRRAIEADDVVMPIKNGATVTVPNTLEEGQQGLGNKTEFNSITFGKVGTYTFTISEDVPDNANATGYTYDRTVWTATVTVTDNGEGALEASAVYNKAGDANNYSQARFTNHYEPEPTSAKLTIEKRITGQKPVRADSFTFLMELVSGPADLGAPSPVGIVTLNMQEGKTIGTVETEEAIFTAAGEYVLKVTERDGGLTGYAYDRSEWTVTGTVVDEGGQLALSEMRFVKDGVWQQGVDRVTFENEYNPTPVSTTLQLRKRFTGANILPGNYVFNFKMSAVGVYAGVAMPANLQETTTVQVTAGQPVSDQPIEFDEIQFSRAGTYHFKLEEILPADTEGIVYDTTPWYARVIVVDDGGTLRVSNVVYSARNDDWVSDPPVIENEYRPDATTQRLRVTKTVTGDFPAGLSAGFVFNLTPADVYPSVTMPTTTSITVGIPNDSGKLTGESMYAAINFSQAGTFTFYINENEPTRYPGFENWDQSQWKAVVEVEDRGGRLAVKSVQYSKMDGSQANAYAASFTNPYVPEPASFTPKVQKSVEGENQPEGTQFAFTIEQWDGDTVLNGTKNLNLTVADGQAEGTFDAISFASAGTYVFGIREKAGSVPGYSYSDDVWQVTVEVADDQQNGKLRVASATYVPISAERQNGKQLNAPVSGMANTEAAKFVNTFTPVSVTLKATKAITGHTPPETRDFNFKLEGEGVNETIRITGADVAQFPELTYNKVGIYNYTIKELVPAESDKAPGYTYDARTWNVTVTVSANENGALVAAVQYTCGLESSTETATFTNEYEPKETSLSLKVQKQVSTAYTLPQPQQFNFTLEVGDENAPGFVMPDNTAASISVNDSVRTGTAEFDAITFSQAGIYTFNINETDEDALGYSYDWAWTVTVTVTDVGGELRAEAWYKSTKPDVLGPAPANKDQAVFINQYTPVPADLSLLLTKRVEGDVLPARMPTFTFSVELQNGDEDGVILQPNMPAIKPTSQLDGTWAGTQTYPVRFKKPGSYIFAIREVVPEEQQQARGYVYDTVEWTVEVVVTDNAGRLETVATYKKDGEETPAPATFVNRYEPEAATVTLNVWKRLTQESGASISQGSYPFTFALTPIGFMAGVSLPQNTTAQVVMPVEADGVLPGDGNVSFNAIRFTRAGTYEFAITENIPVAAGDGDFVYGMEYDASRWVAKVEVVDNGGALSVVSTQYAKGGDGFKNDAPVFVNNYDPAAVTTTLSVTKEILDENNNFLASGENAEFVFTLSEKLEDGEETIDTLRLTLPRGDALSASAVFKTLHYTTAGMHTYYIRENVPEAENRLPGFAHEKGYDRGVWEVTVNVRQVDGNLVVETPVYKREGIQGESSNTAKFTNTYIAKNAELQLAVTKELTGQTPPREQNFEFSLTGDGDGVSATTSITGAGSGQFPKLTYDTVGTHTYTIKEVVPDSPVKPTGYTYDDTVWTVTVVVTNEGGQLKAEAVYNKPGDFQNYASAIFTNHYEPLPVKKKLVVEKQVDGAELPENPHDKFFMLFEFTLRRDMGSPEWPDFPDFPWPFSLRSAEKVEAGPEDGVEFISRSPWIIGEGRDDLTELTFVKPGTYTFKVTENECDAVFTRDTSEWKIVYTVEDAGGKLEVTDVACYKDNEEQTGAESALFVNTYSPEWVDVNLGVSKKLTALDIPDGEYPFAFKLELDGVVGENGVIIETDDVIISDEAKRTSIVVNVADGETSRVATGMFGDENSQILFRSEGTYQFRITEDVPQGEDKIPGITYSTQTWLARVIVQDLGGQLGISRLTGIQYSGDGGDSWSADLPVFTNSYAAESVTATLAVQKTLTGPLPAGREAEFMFSLEYTGGTHEDGLQKPDEDASVTIRLPQEGKRTAKAEFEEIEFTRPGVYSFKITEQIPTAPGFTAYDKSTWTVDVEVIDVASQLVAVVSYNKNGIPMWSANSASFTNPYAPTTFATWTPRVQNTVSGDMRPGETFAYSIAYTGAAALKDGFTMGTDAIFDEDVITGDPHVSNALSFGEITFTKVGTYTFTITQTGNNVPGYTYDTATWTATVEVTDREAQLEATVTYKKVASSEVERSTRANATLAAFENSFAPATAQLKVEKALTGNTPPNDKTFTFELSAEAQDGMRLPADQTIVITGAGTESFANVTLNKVGEYGFSIAETRGSDHGYTYDPNPWTATVTVSADENDALVATVAYARGTESGTETATFTNNYDPDDATIKLAVAKRVMGEDIPDGEYPFAFKLEENGNMDGVTLPESTTTSVITEVRNGMAAQKEAAFADIAFAQAGEYYFTIRENLPQSANGFAYDTTVWHTRVVVTDNNGELQATAFYSVDGEDWSVDAPLFTNEYQPATAVLQVRKTLIGEKQKERQAFIFEISQIDGPMNVALPAELSLMPADPPQDGSDPQPAIGEFDAMQFTSAGEYVFEICERNGGMEGYTYDNVAWKVTVTVVADSIDAALSVASIVYQSNGGETGDAAAFVNEYMVPGLSAVYAPRVIKEIDGDFASDAEFDFTLMPDPANPEGGATLAATSATLNGAGSVTFGEIVFTMAGVYTFTLAEVEGNAMGYDYDARKWELTVDVRRHNGEMWVESSQYVCSDGRTSTEAATFVNVYQPASLTVTKRVRGGDVERKFPFCLTLTDSFGNPLRGELPYTGFNGALSGIAVNGKAVFELAHGQSIALTLSAGTHYKIEELEHEGYRVQCDNPEGVLLPGTNGVVYTNIRRGGNGTVTIPKTGDVQYENEVVKASTEQGAEGEAVPGTDGVIFLTEPESLAVHSDFAELYEQNPDIVGWLIAGESISYPVLQRDNVFYMDHTFEGEYNVAGSIFINEANLLTPRDQVLLIHGHNMKSGVMFGTLRKYAEEEYMRTYPIVTFRTIYDPEDVYYVPVYAFDASMNEGAEGYFDITPIEFESLEDCQRYLDALKERTYWEGADVNPEDELIVLITCSYKQENGRFMLICRKLRDDENLDEMRSMLSR